MNARNNTQPARGRGQDLAKMPAKQQVAALLKSQKNAITQVLPKHISPERLMQVAFTAVRTTPKLLECDQNSLIGAVIQCAQLGLEPNTVLGHCYLVPFKGNVQLIPGYKGLIDLARRSGQIVSIAAHVVHEFDEFHYQYGLTEDLRHIPADGDRGEITHAYAVAHLKDGGHAFEVMTLGEIHEVMLQSQSRGKWGPWKDHFSEMARKTAIRRLSKFLPLSIEFATATALEGKASADEEQNLDGILTGEFNVVDEPPPEAPQAAEADAATESVKERLRSADNPPIEPPTPTEHSGLFDAEGAKFDPEIHAVNKETGEPILNKDKTFRKLPRKPIDTVVDEPPQSENPAPEGLI